jgi:DNA-binding NarL/FixJ family response regulator
MKVSILIFEDNDQLRNSTTTLLESVEDFDVVETYSNCMEVKDIVKKLNPALILMDIAMPGKSGIEAVKEIRSFNSSIHIIMLTVFDNDHHVFDAICAGASGYLLKRHIAEKLVPSIYEVLEGGAPMSPSIAKLVVKSMRDSAKPNIDTYQLTAREKEILASLSCGNSYKLIASELNISIDTVRSHIRHIYEKLQVHSQTEAVSKAIQEKLV